MALHRVLLHESRNMSGLARADRIPAFMKQYTV